MLFFIVVFSSKFPDFVELLMMERHLVKKIAPAIVKCVFVVVMTDLAGGRFGYETVHRGPTGSPVQKYIRVSIPAKVPEDGTPFVEVQAGRGGPVDYSKPAGTEVDGNRIIDSRFIEFNLEHQSSWTKPDR